MILNVAEIDSDYWLLKTDSNGTQQWSQTYFAFGKVTSMIQTSDGGFLLAGGHSTFVKTDSAGAIQWNQTYNEGSVHSIMQTLDGGFAMAGYNTSQGPTIFWLAKTDINGNMVWSHTYSRLNTFDEAWALVQTSDGGYAIAGGGATTGTGANPSGWLVKTDALGNEQWNQTYPGMFYSIIQADDGGYVLAGYTEPASSEKSAGSKMLLVKTDPRGNTLWNQTFGDNAVAWSVIQTLDGGYAMAGDSLVKTDATGEIEWNQTLTGEAFSVIQTQTGTFAMTGGDAGASSAGAWLELTGADNVSPSPTFTESPSPTASASPSLSPQPTPSSTPSPSVPEFQSWFALPLLIVMVLAAVFARKTKS
jgi:YD repeat-containing protein